MITIFFMGWIAAPNQAGAIYNFDEPYDVPGCHHQTRAVLNDIMQWVVNLCWGGSNSILWLHGPAGTIETPITKTIAEIATDKNFLFFFTEYHVPGELRSSRPNTSIVQASVYQFLIPRLIKPFQAKRSRTMHFPLFALAQTKHSMCSESDESPVYAAALYLQNKNYNVPVPRGGEYDTLSNHDIVAITPTTTL